jgi:hypothetical protein
LPANTLKNNDISDMVPENSTCFSGVEFSENEKKSGGVEI